MERPNKDDFWITFDRSSGFKEVEYRLTLEKYANELEQRLQILQQTFNVDWVANEVKR